MFTGEKRTRISNKLAGSVREGEGISQEEPLEGDNADTHHGQVHHAERVLSAQQSRVKETAWGQDDGLDAGDLTI